jgi:hypothetical protein
MAKPKVTRKGDTVVVSIPMTLRGSKTDQMFADAMAEWTGKGYTLVSNSRIGRAGGVLTFVKQKF